MTKADIVEKINEKVGLPKRESAELFESVLSIIKSTLESGEKVKVSGFGIFEIKKKADRRGRNPFTGEEMTIVARRRLSFKPSALLKKP